jgi:hypothetical protein
VRLQGFGAEDLLVRFRSDCEMTGFYEQAGAALIGVLKYFPEFIGMQDEDQCGKLLYEYWIH